MEHERIGETEMKRPTFIYELLGKISDGTFLNEKQFRELEAYIGDLERYAPNCPDCQHAMMNHMVVDIGTAFVVECYETDECKCLKPCGENTELVQSKPR
jgi:hypothetical protein